MACVSPDKSITTPKTHIDGVPDFGWRVPLTYKCQEKCGPFQSPRLKQLTGFVGLTVRYMQFWFKKRNQGRIPFINHLDPVMHNPIYGCPIGGIGCGTIGRGYRGEFCRFQMVAGMYNFAVVDADQFVVCIRKNGNTVYQQVLSAQPKKTKGLGSWKWHFPQQDATYHALYPRAWTIYDIPEHKVRLVCRQISPVFPHDYKETTLPTAVFVWSIENNGDEELEISIMFTFKNGRGIKEDKDGGCWNEPFSHKSDDSEVQGVMIHQAFRDMDCTYAVSAAKKDGVSVSHCVEFDPNGSGEDVWNDLKEDGSLNSVGENSAKTKKGKEIATAVCAKCTVKPHGKGQLDFCLAWDMPVILFAAREQKYARRYTRWFGTKGDAAPRLCAHALISYPAWEEKIEQWQNPFLSNSKLPAWYKSALFNELYFVSDGGTIWVDPIADSSAESSVDPVPEYSKFAYLEGHEYRMYNTYDVHHYASFAFIMLWPKIQESIQYDIADSVVSEDLASVKFCMSGEKGIVKTANTVPHDIGDPEDEPWKRVNAYIIHPTCDWKDLNLKFVLQVYRDYSHTHNEEFLKYMYPKIKLVMETALTWDTDGDGIIDNSGFADQTYDAWTMQGASAYCGGMWLAALRMVVDMAKHLGFDEDQAKYAEVLERGKKSYQDKLWNGRYYNFDCSQHGHHDSVMADQLAGQWFLKASGLQDDTVFPPANVKSALKTVFENNVMMFSNGNMGAINGTRPDGKKDISSCQSEEFWVGITYSVAASMIQEGLIDEGFQTAWGSYHACWEWMGLAFQTPEAYMTSRHYRSLGYMRPLSIWSLQWALEKFHPEYLNVKTGESQVKVAPEINKEKKSDSGVSLPEKSVESEETVHVESVKVKEEQADSGVSLSDKSVESEEKAHVESVKIKEKKSDSGVSLPEKSVESEEKVHVESVKVKEKKSDSGVSLPEKSAESEEKVRVEFVKVKEELQANATTDVIKEEKSGSDECAETESSGYQSSEVLPS
ncbi:non-lysosomal glucosylceramidase-like [Gigantopelta aegis]|uniref:non-lysosomal glucosylceramidase-like n=1 Tax=Gigantopelta aegis TaxID=1735272 RepID=UPI001B88B566|nr:non-lysosomal glucosylceramidase-like [Gigantopelta aegis]